MMKAFIDPRTPRSHHGILSAAVCLVLFSAAGGAAGQGPLRVEGSGFTVERLNDGVSAFSNRKYVLGDVPALVRGWQFTRLAGGERAILTVTPSQDTEIFVFTSPKFTRLVADGWKPVESGTFHYSAKKEGTPLAVFVKFTPAGKPLWIPQGNWSGCMVAAPQIAATLRPKKLDCSLVPGVVISHLAADTRCYVGSPSIAELPDGQYVASHDLFGPGSTYDLTLLFRSADRGRTWRKLGEIKGQFWSTLFVHRGSLYILGPNRQLGSVVIRRSDDGGSTWTRPIDGKSGLLADGRYHCGPMPVVEFDGRLWRAMEESVDKELRPLMISAPVDADLLDAGNWICSNRPHGNREWLGGEFDSWREGNAVVSPEGRMLDILRVDTNHYPERAAIVEISRDGRTASFDPERGFIDLPGGSKKFTIRFDPRSNRYWSLVSAGGPPGPANRKPSQNRNGLALVSSADLRQWTICRVLLQHADVFDHGFQYVDWQFDGEDLIAACRTAYDDGLGGADSFHNANFLTFHRIDKFRQPDFALEPARNACP